ncbi:hypothetical protein C0Q70_18038 [Pomacea canaliculata]|uniref:Uncharacterized protein n=2 Tax=Pomacea canaliculata TaxID=400727 RepID=A0A2T7NM47_POMCA|nr:hypothetical protein C0Q70_18038 [Pomacea canaliculata]
MSSSTKSCDHKNSLNSPVGGANARDVIWTLFPPSAAGLLPKKSRWIRPLVDGKEAWSLLDDDIIKATDFKVCLGLVIKAKLEREGVITLPSDLRAGVEEVTSYEEAMQKIEQYIEKRKREKDPVMANL